MIFKDGPTCRFSVFKLNFEIIKMSKISSKRNIIIHKLNKFYVRKSLRIVLKNNIIHTKNKLKWDYIFKTYTIIR